MEAGLSGKNELVNVDAGKTTLEFRKIIFLLLSLVFTLASWVIINIQYSNRSYSVFMVFDTANGIEKGTTVRIKGLTVGSIFSVIDNRNVIVAIAHINKNIANIHQDSLVETNQAGLFSETAIDIVPLDNILYNSHEKINPFGSECTKSSILCHLSFTEGNRGFNYDDFIRTTTRISQRLDDPRFSNLSYLFWQPGIKLSHKILEVPTNFPISVRLLPPRIDT